MSDTPPPPSIDTSTIPRSMISVTSNLLTNDQVADLRADARALYAAGAFVPGGLRRRNNNNANKNKNNNNTAIMGTTTDATTRICDVCGIFDDAEREDLQNVGNRVARDDLLDLMADLRVLLQNELSIELSESMELQYLRYPGRSKNDTSDNNNKKKGFYGRHFDSSSDDIITRKRKVSLLLYLNEDGWDGDKDGGILRAYIPPKKKTNSGSDGANQQDVVPEGGKLVLFDSKTVEHEVLPTTKERWAVVGWFLSDDTTKQRSSDKTASAKKRQHYPGDDQQRTKRKKKKRRRGR